VVRTLQRGDKKPPLSTQNQNNTRWELVGTRDTKVDHSQPENARGGRKKKGGKKIDDEYQVLK